MLTIVTWKWSPPQGYRSMFGPETVNTLAAMIARHYPHPHRVLCVTDHAHGIDSHVQIVPPDLGHPEWPDYADLPSPFGRKNPSCYRRLRAFHPDIGSVFGERFVSIDLDVVITGDLTPLWHRSEDVVFYGDTHPRTHFNGSMMLLTAGARPQVWTTFHPQRSPMLARSAGFYGSDQAFISYCLGPKEAKWTRSDGVYSFRNHIKRTPGCPLPNNAKVVIFHGSCDPWDSRAQSLRWVREYYRMNEVAA